jgi:signal transduction histidine kinase
MQPMLLLQVIEGPDQGRVFPLPVDEPQLIGRSTEAIPSTDTSISRRHAELTPDEGTWSVRDLDSANGTYVNDIRIESRTTLVPGDHVRCGSTRFQIIDTGNDMAGPIGNLELDRLATVGQTVGSISHAIKNILQGLRGGASAIELAIDRGDLELAREGWPILSRNLDRIYDLTFNLLTFARTRGVDLERGALMPLLEDVAELVRPLAERRRVRVSAAVDPEIPLILHDCNALHQAVLNLALNAVEAAPSKSGEVRIHAGWEEEPGRAWIVVEDNGPGIEPQQREEVFRPFSSTKGQRGTGLGLAVTMQLVADHGGSIELDTSELGGARFRILLPGTGPEDPGETTGPRPMGTPPDHDLEFDE